MTAPLGFRVPPRNLEAEKTLLGAILSAIQPYERVKGMLRPEHFYEPVHGRIYALIDRLASNGHGVDPILIGHAFDDDEVLRELGGGLEYLAALVRSAETILEPERYAEHIVDLAARRALIGALEQGTNELYDLEHSRPLPDLGAELRQGLDQIEREAPGAAPPLSAAIDASGLDLAALARRTPPGRRYAWNPWIPARTATLLHGFGGAGKSLLVQQIATAYALGLDLFGGATEGRPALFLAGDDDHDELWRRQLAICRRLGARLEDLAGKLDLRAVPHLDVTLAEANDAGSLTTTPMLDALRARIERARFGLVALDYFAKLFAVREGDRIGVTRCVGLLHAICQDFDATVVLVAHDNRGGDYSGSTAWENTCRARLHLTRDDDGQTRLAMPKANYSASGEIKLAWDDWSFRADDPAAMSYGERLEAETTARAHGEVFLRALDALTAQGRNVSDNARSGNYAPRVILEHGLGEGLGRRQLAAAMTRLMNEGRLRANEPVAKGPDRHWRSGLARTTAA